MPSSWIRPEKRLAINLRDGMACAYCGKNLTGAEPSDVTPRPTSSPATSRSPTAAAATRPRTLVTACRSCNSSRQDKPWVDYATGGARDRNRNPPLPRPRPLPQAREGPTSPTRWATRPSKPPGKPSRPAPPETRERK